MTDSDSGKSACKGCRNTINTINGLYCTRLNRNVEYCKTQPCTKVFN